MSRDGPRNGLPNSQFAGDPEDGLGLPEATAQVLLEAHTCMGQLKGYVVQKLASQLPPTDARNTTTNRELPTVPFPDEKQRQDTIDRYVHVFDHLMSLVRSLVTGAANATLLCAIVPPTGPSSASAGHTSAAALALGQKGPGGSGGGASVIASASEQNATALVALLCQQLSVELEAKAMMKGDYLRLVESLERLRSDVMLGEAMEGRLVELRAMVDEKSRGGTTITSTTTRTNSVASKGLHSLNAAHPVGSVPPSLNGPTSISGGDVSSASRTPTASTMLASSAAIEQAMKEMGRLMLRQRDKCDRLQADVMKLQSERALLVSENYILSDRVRVLEEQTALMSATSTVTLRELQKQRAENAKIAFASGNSADAMMLSGVGTAMALGSAVVVANPKRQTMASMDPTYLPRSAGGTASRLGMRASSPAQMSQSSHLGRSDVGSSGSGSVRPSTSTAAGGTKEDSTSIEIDGLVIDRTTATWIKDMYLSLQRTGELPSVPTADRNDTPTGDVPGAVRYGDLQKSRGSSAAGGSPVVAPKPTSVKRMGNGTFASHVAEVRAQ